MPGASSPLGLSVMARTLDISIQRRLRTRTGGLSPVEPYSSKTIHISRQRVLLSVINTFLRSNDEKLSPALIGMELSTFGHRVIDDELHRIGIERHGISSGLTKIRELLSLINVSHIFVDAWKWTVLLWLLFS
jgi:hypothetical protein